MVPSSQTVNTSSKYKTKTTNQIISKAGASYNSSNNTYVSGQSEVNNSTVTNSSITLAGEYVGGIAGFGFGTGNTVSNTNVTGTNYVGGISGKAWGSKNPPAGF